MPGQDSTGSTGGTGGMGNMGRGRRPATLAAAGLAAWMALSVWTALAAEIPAAGPLDHRMRTVDYHAGQVFEIAGHYGWSTHIWFSPQEKIEQVALGDSEAWQVRPVNNHLFLKPAGPEAATNMTVITNRRVYNFSLDAHTPHSGRAPDLMFQIRFRYPEEEARRQAAQAAEREQARQLAAAQQRSPPRKNMDYHARGSTLVTPAAAWDDGRFTWLTFPAAAPMPAIYRADSAGNETLVNTTIDPDDPDTIIVMGVAAKFVLRLGAEVVCLQNRGFDPHFDPRGDPPAHTGTIAPGVVRTLK